MKAEALAEVFSAVVATLRDANADQQVTDALQELASFLRKYSGKTIAQIARTCRPSTKPALDSAITANAVLPVLERLASCLHSVVKKEVDTDLIKLVSLLQELGDTPLAELENVASASPPRTRRPAAAMDQSKIESYLRRLEDSLGNRGEFRTVFDQLKKDTTITKHEAVHIANRFNGPVPPSTTRPKALEAIFARHRKVVEFDEGSESIDGQDAA